ncbi:hypothetical protein [Arcobacter defluvii]|uniref:Uncharacterized protein n=1 Tax=Arcobacter defluvii TaxID=873191 RepID=A0AAE7E7Y3_9BACT|nr:hypothetical protein [Arcobacter defluvii]QKF78244.1 hypothetical protein ADFLV_2236 [Arcobacter defluvii]RXI33348.1 hypothetical protein CP964_07185 [Arcobacter defluvii]
MPIEDCSNRSSINNRQNIVNEYDLIPISHIQLLSNQTKQNCCGPALTDSYYVFSYKNKLNPNDNGYFNVGIHCANEFLQLTNQNALPIFNILMNNNQQNNNVNNNQQNNNVNNQRPIINKQLENAINLFIAHNDVNPFGYFYKILNFVRTANAITNDASIREVNRVIGSYFQTIPDIINSLSQHNNLRAFNFTELHNHIINNNILPNGNNLTI